MSDDQLRHSPLDAQHRALGARMVPFGGWDMPLQYAGVLEEHRACRDRRGRVRRLAPRARSSAAARARSTLLQWLLTNDLRKIERGRAQYTHLLDPDRRARRRRHHRVVGRRRSLLRDAERVEHRRAARRVRRRARPTPTARSSSPTSPRRARCSRCRVPRRARCSRRSSADAAAVPRFAVARGGRARRRRHRLHGRGRRRDPRRRGRRARRCGTRSCAAGIDARRARARATRCASRRACRCTATSSGPGITPLQAGLGWVVGWDKADFRGRAALAAEREQGIARRLRGLSVEGRRPPREGSRVLRDGRRSAWSRAATSRRCSGTASRSRSCRPTSRPATRCRSTCAVSCSTRASCRCRS